MAKQTVSVMGGYKVQWVAGYTGGETRIYIGLNDLTAIEAGTDTVENALKRVIAKHENVKIERIKLNKITRPRKTY